MERIHAIELACEGLGSLLLFQPGPACRLRRVLVAALVCAGFLSSVAFGRTAEAVSERGGARIEVGQTKVDRGDIFYTKSVSHVFEFQNVGDAPLTLEVKKRSCQCLSDLFDCTEVAPGASGKLKIGYSPRNPPTKAGLNFFTVLVGTNDPEKPEILFSVKVRLVRSVEAAPSTLDFGSLSPGEESVKELAIECFGEDTVPEILSYSCVSPFLTVEEVPGEHDEHGVSTRHYRVVIEAPEAPGSFGTAIQFATTSARIPFLEIPVQAFVPYPIKVHPERVLFGIVEPDTQSSREIRLRVPSSVPDSLRWTCPDERVTADLAPEGSGDERVLIVTLSTPFSGDKRIENLKTAISIVSGDEQVVARIPVHAVIKRPKSE